MGFTTINLGQVVPPKSNYKTFDEVKSGEYLYIYDRETDDIYFMRVDEVLDYEEYIKRQPSRYPETSVRNISKNVKTINIRETNLFKTSYFWFKYKEDPNREKYEKEGYYCTERFAGQYVSTSNFISKFESFNWYLVGFDTGAFRSNSWICTTADEAIKFIKGSINENRCFKNIIYNNIT